MRPRDAAKIFKHLFHAAEGAYLGFAVGRSGGLRSQGGVKLPTGGNAPSGDEPAGAFRLRPGGTSRFRCDPGADGHSPVMRTVERVAGGFRLRVVGLPLSRGPSNPSGRRTMTQTASQAHAGVPHRQRRLPRRPHRLRPRALARRHRAPVARRLRRGVRTPGLPARDRRALRKPPAPSRSRCTPRRWPARAATRLSSARRSWWTAASTATTSWPPPSCRP